MGAVRDTFGTAARLLPLPLLALLTFLCLVVPSTSVAATEPFGPKRCLNGSGAGECDRISGVAASQANGHIYVSDVYNSRINEFTAWGEFVKSWGWGVEDGSSELQVCTSETDCLAGQEGTGAGQFVYPAAVAVDSAGDIYVFDTLANRVQKFDPEGGFLLMIGGGVNQGPNDPGNLCTVAQIEASDICGAGTAGTGDGQFAEIQPSWNGIAVGLDDELFVGDRGRIQEFTGDGSFVRVLPDPDQLLRNGNPAEDKLPGSLAVDPVSGDIYLTYPNDREILPTRSGVYLVDRTSGELIDSLDVRRPAALATGVGGDLFVFDQMRFTGATSDPLNHSSRIFKFDSSGALLETIGEVEIFTPNELYESKGMATSSFCFGAGETGLYVGVPGRDIEADFLQAFGPTPDPTKCPPPAVPPKIDAQFAASVGTDSAVLKAEINPHYFTSPIGTTTFYLQWGTAECIDGDGWGASCVQTQPAPPGTTLDSPPVDEAVTAQAVLSELAPETAYRYRFVAEGSGAPGEPVFGAGGVPGVEGTDAEVTTMSSASTLPPCSNDAFRLGSGGALRDCRAYELVSPLDKAGGDVQARLNLVYFEARADQASTSGDEVTFSAYRAFQDPESAPFSSQFLTRRDPAVGWQTEAISPPQEGEAFINPGLAIDNLYRAFAPDLSQSWLYTYTEPLLGPGAIAGEPNVYRRDNETATYQACTVTPPLSDQAETHGAQLQGFSESGDLAVFKIEGKLTADGSDQTKSGGRPINQVYACSYTGGVAEVRLVSALPSGEASDLENSAGGPANELFQFDQGRAASLDNAVAADGSKVFWTASAADDTEQPGALYLRLNPGAPPTVSGTCDVAEADKACTVQISAGPARLWTAAEDGSVAFFSDASGQLYEYRVATASTLPVAADVVGVLGASENGRRLYFISEADLAEGAVADEPNLYLYQRGVGNTFIAGLSELDAQQGDAVPSPGNSQPAWHTARVTPDGSAVVFMSNNAELAELVAEYDNTDQLTGLPAGEIYRFAIGEELSCISCNRTGQRPRGRQVQNKLGPNPILPVASMLPTWLNSLYAPRVVSADGTRIFFEAFEPLVARDTNGKADVYQWEAEGIGSCTATDSAYDPQSEGCVSLISSGTSTTDSQFVDASPEGDDVFIRTAAPLVDWDPGAIDIYDARVGGGFSAPSLPPNPEDECKGESCAPPVRPIPPPAIPPTTAPGDGNVRQPKPKTCPKGKRKVKRNGKVSCVKAKKQNRKAKKGNDKARQTRSADR